MLFETHPLTHTQNGELAGFLSEPNAKAAREGESSALYIHRFVTTRGRKYRDSSNLHEKKVYLIKGQDLAIG